MDSSKVQCSFSVFAPKGATTKTYFPLVVVLILKRRREINEIFFLKRQNTEFWEPLNFGNHHRAELCSQKGPMDIQRLKLKKNLLIKCQVLFLVYMSFCTENTINYYKILKHHAGVGSTYK